MKLVALWLTGIVLALAAAGSCSVNHRSGDFACENSRDCAAGRVCIDGSCVVAGQPLDAGVDATSLDAPPLDAHPDAPIPIDAPPACPAQCTSCDLDGKTCKVDCSLDPNLCTRPISCPVGFSCDIECSTERSCRFGVACDNSNPTCTISCSGSSSCRNVTCNAGSCDLSCLGPSSCSNVDCGLGKCNIDCVGQGACSDVSCGQACACDLRCGIDSLCFPTTCPFDKCSDGVDGCTSQPLGCNLCQ